MKYTPVFILVLIYSSTINVTQCFQAWHSHSRTIPSSMALTSSSCFRSNIIGSISRNAPKSTLTYKHDYIFKSRSRLRLWTSNTNTNDFDDRNKLDDVLSNLTNMFPLFVLSAAIIGARAPHLLVGYFKFNYNAMFICIYCIL